MAGEEEEALIPQRINVRSSRSKSVFQIPWGVTSILGGGGGGGGGGAGGGGGGDRMRGCNRNRLVLVVVKYF